MRIGHHTDADKQLLADDWDAGRERGCASEFSMAMGQIDRNEWMSLDGQY